MCYACFMYVPARSLKRPGVIGQQGGEEIIVKYRDFGRTGLRVSELVFGGGAVGGLLINQDDEARRAAVRRALDAGINWFDTAAQYGQGKSEEALGWLLDEIDEAPYLSTKVRLDVDRLDDIRGQVEKSLEQSLTRLRRDRVDLFQLHNAIGPRTDGRRLGIEAVLGKGGVADAMDRLRAQGLIRFAGITGLGEAAATRQVIASRRFHAAQIYYNLLNPSAGRPVPPAWSGHDFSGLIQACKENGVAAMGIRVFAAGVIATDIRHGREAVLTEGSEIPLEEERTRQAFEALGTDHGTRAQTAVRFALANQDLACVLVGLADMAQLDEALSAAHMGPLPDQALARLAPLHATDFGLLRWGDGIGHDERQIGDQHAMGQPPDDPHGEGHQE